MNLIRWARTQWDRVAGATLVFLGAVAIVIGWHGVSHEGLTAQQIPYVVSGGIGGLFLLGVGGILWLSADLRDEWRKLDAIERSQAPALPIAVELPVDDPFVTTAPLEPEAVPPKPTAAKRARPAAKAAGSRR